MVVIWIIILLFFHIYFHIFLVNSGCVVGRGSGGFFGSADFYLVLGGWWADLFGGIFFTYTYINTRSSFPS